MAHRSRLVASVASISCSLCRETKCMVGKQLLKEIQMFRRVHQVGFNDVREILSARRTVCKNINYWNNPPITSNRWRVGGGKEQSNMIDSERTNRGTPTIFIQGENEERSHSTATAHRSARTNFQKYYKVRKRENGNTTKHRCHRILPQGYDEEKNNKNDT